MKIIRSGNRYVMQKIGKDRYRLSRIIKEYKTYEEMAKDNDDLLFGEVTEEEVSRSWKPES